MCFAPKLKRDSHWIDPGLGPPSGFIAVAMDFAMVPAAERNGEFVADFAAQCA